MVTLENADRIDKWVGREAEWYRLAGSCCDAHIADVCRSLAKQAGEMADFFGRKKVSTDGTPSPRVYTDADHQVWVDNDV